MLKVTSSRKQTDMEVSVRLFYFQTSPSHMRWDPMIMLHPFVLPDRSPPQNSLHGTSEHVIIVKWCFASIIVFVSVNVSCLIFDDLVQWWWIVWCQFVILDSLWEVTCTLAPPPSTPPFPWLHPSYALFICSQFSLDVNNSCNICQVINVGCLKGEGIIWELMTCVTKQYCVLWHFARLICVSNHSTLPLYPQALPSGPGGGSTPFTFHSCFPNWLCAVCR